MRSARGFDASGSRMGAINMGEFGRLQELFNALAPQTESDESGEPRLVAPEGVLRTDWIVGLKTPRNTKEAWRQNQDCVECSTPIDRVENAALVILPDKSHRVAHRKDCIVAHLRARMNELQHGKGVTV